MTKVTILYGNPENKDAFEKYYAETHMPIAGKMKGLTKLELTKFLPAADGAKPSYHRMAELYFPNQADMQQTLDSPEGKAAIGDLPNFATGGVTMLVGEV